MLAISILALFVETSVISAFNEDLSPYSIPESRDNWLYVVGSEHGNYSDIQATKNLTYRIIKELTYTEQPPSPL